MARSDPPRKVFVHLLVHNPAGPIQGMTTNLHVACDPTSAMPESASHVATASVITCPLCLVTPEYAELNAEMDSASSADRKAAAHIAAQEKAEADALARAQAATKLQEDATAATPATPAPA